MHSFSLFYLFYDPMISCFWNTLWSWKWVQMKLSVCVCDCEVTNGKPSTRTAMWDTLWRSVIRLQTQNVEREVRSVPTILRAASTSQWVSAMHQCAKITQHTQPNCNSNVHKIKAQNTLLWSALLILNAIC